MEDVSGVSGAHSPSLARMTRAVQRFGGFGMAAAMVLLAGCGGGGSSSATTAVATSTPGDTATTAAPAASDPTATEAPTTLAPTTTVPHDPWSVTAADDLAALLAAREGTGTVDVFRDLFGLPVEIEWPADAALTDTMVDVQPAGDGTWSVRLSLAAATMETPEALEATLSGFADERFAFASRVVSTLDSGVWVNLNYSGSAAGEADGWDYLAISIGPETSFGSGTGRNEVTLIVERLLPAYPADLAWFLVGWIDEMPVAEGLEQSTISAFSTDRGVWLETEFTAPADQFEDLVAFYAQDHSGGALDLSDSSMPDDLSTIDRLVAGFFPTLAGYVIWVTVERDLADPDAGVTVALEVRVEPED